MRLAVFLVTAVATTTASACTFEVSSSQTNNAGGGGSYDCSVGIQPENRDHVVGPPYNGKYKTIGCQQGCHKMHYRGRTWKFCHTGLAPWKDQLHSPRISIQETDNAGTVLSISRDGRASHRGGEGPFSSWETNNWWRKGIGC